MIMIIIFLNYILFNNFINNNNIINIYLQKDKIYLFFFFFFFGFKFRVDDNTFLYIKNNEIKKYDSNLI